SWAAQGEVDTSCAERLCSNGSAVISCSTAACDWAFSTRSRGVFSWAPNAWGAPQERGRVPTQAWEPADETRRALVGGVSLAVDLDARDVWVGDEDLLSRLLTGTDSLAVDRARGLRELHIGLAGVAAAGVLDRLPRDGDAPRGGEPEAFVRGV